MNSLTSKTNNLIWYTSKTCMLILNLPTQLPVCWSEWQNPKIDLKNEFLDPKNLSVDMKHIYEKHPISTSKKSTHPATGMLVRAESYFLRYSLGGGRNGNIISWVGPGIYILAIPQEGEGGFLSTLKNRKVFEGGLHKNKTPLCHTSIKLKGLWKVRKNWKDFNNL